MLKKNKGFSLVEAILSVFLVTLGLVVAVSLVTKGLGESMDSANQNVAALLAQEGIELVRNVRDNNWANEASGGDSFYRFPSESSDCRIDKNFSYGSNMTCNLSSFSQFRLRSDDNKFYIHSGTGDLGIFYRKITISPVGTNAKTITSMVAWGSEFPGSKANCHTASKCVYSEVTLNRWGGE